MLALTLGICIVLLTVILFSVSFVAYRIAFFSKNDTPDDINKIPDKGQYHEYREKILLHIGTLAAADSENIWITSRDGKRLHAKYYHTADGAPLDICMHGYRSSAMRDFCGGYGISRRMGHNILLVDQRAHGESEGHTISFGIKERYDCLDFVNYAVKRFGKVKIMLYGVSMGAATVLMAAGEKMPDNVVGVVADCPYSSPEKIIKKVCRDRKIPAFIMMPFARFGAMAYGGFSLSETDPVRAAERAKVPILLIHGEGDTFVPHSMSVEIYEKNKKSITLESFPDADHAMSYMIDSEKYERIVTDFASECLAGKE